MQILVSYIYTKLELLAGWRGEGQEACVCAFAVDKLHSWVTPIAVCLYCVFYSWENKKGLTLRYIGLINHKTNLICKALSGLSFTY